MDMNYQFQCELPINSAEMHQKRFRLFEIPLVFLHENTK